MVAGKRLFLFDLDGTLLRSDKTISKKTLAEVSKLRDKSNIIGISTSRSEQNCKSFLGELKPDIMIVSGGALVKKENEYIFKAVFSKERTKEKIQTARTGNIMNILVLNGSPRPTGETAGREQLGDFAP